MDPFEAHKRRQKWVWGCTAGCLSFLLVVAVVIFAGYRLLGRSVPVVPPETFVPADATAFFFVWAEADDPLAVEIPARLLRLPTFVQAAPAKDREKFRIDADEARGVVLSMAPMQIVLVLRPGEGEEPFRWGAVVSIRSFSRLYGFVMRSIMLQAAPSSEMEEYKDASIVSAPAGRVLAARRNNYMAADGKEIVTFWVDRLEERRALEDRAAEEGQPAPAPEIGGDLQGPHGRLDHERPIRFACLNPGGELAALLALVPEGQARDLIEASGVLSEGVVSVAGQMEGLNSRDAALELFVECADGDTAAYLKDALEVLLAEASDASPLREARVSLDGDAGLRLEARVANLPDKIARLVAYLIARS